jgi:RHS repeat-associated protein
MKLPKHLYAVLFATTILAVPAQPKPPGGQNCQVGDPLTACNITGPVGTICVGAPASFTITPSVDWDYCGDGVGRVQDEVTTTVDWGDGTTSSDTYTHTYTTCGDKTVTVTCADVGLYAKDSNTQSASCTVTVHATWSTGTPIQCTITSPTTGQQFAPGESITLSCSATDNDVRNCGTSEDVAETAFTYQWHVSAGTVSGTGSSVQWTAPLSGTATISVTADDTSSVPSGDCGSRDDGAADSGTVTLSVAGSPSTTDDDPQPPDVPVPVDPSCSNDNGCSSCGAAKPDPVILANGTEDYGPVQDISAYNPHGPSIGYARKFNSAQAGTGYHSPGLSPGWTDNYDIKVLGPTPSGTWNNVKIIYQNGSQEQWAPLPGGGLPPNGQLTPPTGAQYTVQGSPSGTPGQWNSFTVTHKDQTKWVWVPKSGDPNTYLLSSIVDRMGHSVSITRVSGSPDKIDHISNDQSAVLLQFYYGTTGYIEQIKSSVGMDSSMPSVFYRFGVDSGSGLSTVCLLTTSTPCDFDAIQRPVTSIATNLTRYAYGYCARNSQPYLHSTTVLDPSSTTPSLTSTAYINYDTSGKVTSVVDANSNQRVYTYNVWDFPGQGYGTRVEVKDAAGNVVQRWVQRYDPAKRNIDLGRTDGAGNHTLIEYTDPANPNRPTIVTNAGGDTTRYSYDSYGNILTVTNPCGMVTTYGYSYDATYYPLGRRTSVQEGTNLAQPKAATTYTYDTTTGLLLTMTTPPPNGSGGENSITEYTYDGLGNVLTSTVGKYLLNGTVYSTNAILTTYNYTTDGSYTQAAAKSEPLTVTTGDTGVIVVTHFRYDGRGNVTSTWDAFGNTTTKTYNPANQVTQVIEPATGDTGTGNVHTVSNYIYAGGPLYRTDLYDEATPANLVRQVFYTYGHEGEQLSITGSTEPVTYTYDAAYHRATLADGNASVTHYDYDPDTGWLLQTRYPNPDNTAAPYDRVTYTYDADGRAHTQTDGRGQMATYTYNDCGFLTDIQYTGQSSQNVHIDYDAYNRRESMTDASGSTTYTYDDLNNVATVTTSFTNGPQSEPITYNYWPNGARKTMVTPAGTFTYTYDAVGRLYSLANPLSETSYWNYDANGRLAYQYLANGLQTSYTYNARGFLDTLKNEVVGVDVYSNFAGQSGGARMTYDAAGNRTGMGVTGTLADSVVHPGNVSYTYTNKNELWTEVSTRVGGTLDQGFGYDSAGNPTTLRGTGSIPYNTDNQRTGTQTYVYDGNGNATTYKGTTLTFDVANRMTAYGNALTEGYNGNGLRAWKTASGTTTYYLYDGTDLLCEMNASGNVTATNTWGANGLVSRRVGTTSTFYVYDPQGSVAERLDASENVVSSDLYDAYGNKLAGNPNNDPYGYDGQWGYYTDSETGLALCTHRYYDPTNGRWLTPDPIGYDGGINVYTYVNDAPSTYIDASGLSVDDGVPSFGTVCAKAYKDWGDCLGKCMYEHYVGDLKKLGCTGFLRVARGGAGGGSRVVGCFPWNKEAVWRKLKWGSKTAVGRAIALADFDYALISCELSCKKMMHW